MAEIEQLERAQAPIFERALGRPLLNRAAFTAQLRSAVAAGQPWAAGKLGHATQYWLSYPNVLARPGLPALVRKAYEQRLLFEAHGPGGLFPVTLEFLLAYNDFYVPHLRQIDCLGLFFHPPGRELNIVRHYQLTNQFMYYQDQEPDRSVPSNDQQCYLPSFAGRRLLLICPFAPLLAERANQATFEAVWANTGKRWFYPAQVDALGFPFGFAAETQRRYGRALVLFEALATEIARRDFDIALIAASALALPLAAVIRQQGKIALDLGGHLQVLFGVAGQRWRASPVWQRDYPNAAWIDIPAEYRPPAAEIRYPGYW